ncbi:hypothetical protein C8R46DRAFT_1209823 [Mycena filopes]|nr:hypothetical protein C8R46DRAFT_1209823 [Mycena filopes]
MDRELRPVCAEALRPVERAPPEIISEIFIHCRNNSRDRDEKLNSIEYDSEDEEANTAGCASVLDPKKAPMVLTHVSSRWRTIAHSAPALWDTVYVERAVIIGESTMSLLRTLLERSCKRELNLAILAPYSPVGAPILSRSTAVSHLLWDLRGRLRHLRLHIPSFDVIPHSFPGEITFPVLQSLTISIVDSVDVLSGVLELFKHSPSLRVLDLVDHHRNSSTFLDAHFPWSQLTSLKNSDTMNLVDARRLLLHCPRLESCSLWIDSPATCSPLRPPLTLRELHLLDLQGTSDALIKGFFESLSLPALQTFSLNSFVVPVSALLALHSHSSLSNLRHLDWDCSFYLEDDVLEFLRVLPGLESLAMSLVPAEVFLKMFTYRCIWRLPPLSLPHLKKLTLAEYDSSEFNAPDVLAFAESILQYPGAANESFPSLEGVHLHITGPQFNAEVEDRLAVICASTDRLVDVGVDKRRAYIPYHST